MTYRDEEQSMSRRCLRGAKVAMLAYSMGDLGIRMQAILSCTGRVLALVLFLSGVVSCADGESVSDPLRFAVAGTPSGDRIALGSEGAAVIDLVDGVPACDGLSRCVVVPTDPVRTRHVMQVAATYWSGTEATRAVPGNGEVCLVFAISRGGTVERFSLSCEAYDAEPMVRGIHLEYVKVSRAVLAKACYLREVAERAFASGDRSEGMDLYFRALKLADAWGRSNLAPPGSISDGEFSVLRGDLLASRRRWTALTAGLVSYCVKGGDIHVSFGPSHREMQAGEKGQGSREGGPEVIYATKVVPAAEDEVVSLEASRLRSFLGK